MSILPETFNLSLLELCNNHYSASQTLARPLAGVRATVVVDEVCSLSEKISTIKDHRGCCPQFSHSTKSDCSP